jgi:tetratricopeptide (TPR) repeat protein
MTRFTIPAFAAVLLVTASCSKDPEQAKREYLESGNRYFAEEKYKEAVVEYRNAIQQDPKFGEARYKLAETYVKLQDARNAYREYIRAADLMPTNIDAQIKAGTLLLLGGQFEDAKTRAGKVLALNPKHLEAQVLRANATAGLKDLDGAIAEINEAIQLDPSKATTYANLGALEQVRGNKVEAEAAYKKAVETDPKSVAAQLAYANFLLSTDRRAEAEASIKRAIEVDPKHVTANRALAVLYMTSNRAAEAEPLLKTVAAESKGGDARLQLADFYLLTNRPSDALRVLEGLAAESDFYAQAKTRIAAVQLSQGRRKEANATVDQVLGKQPKNAMALLAKAQLLLQDKQPDAALERVKAAAAADPQYVPAQYMLGTLYAQRGETEEARKALQEVLKLNPRAVAAQLQLSHLELARGSAEISVQLAQDAVNAQPENPLARLLLARSLTARGELERAETEVKALLAKYPNVSAVHSQAGLLALARRDSASATREFTRAAQIDPNSFEALTGLVTLDMQARKPADALKRIEAQLTRTPTSAPLYLLEARVKAETSDFAGAEQALRKAIELDSSMIRAYGLLGQIYITQRKPDQAIAEFEQIVKKQPKNVAAHTMIAMLLQSQGKNAEAQKRYEAVLAIDNRAAVAANNLAWIYAENNVNLDQALQLAQTAKASLPDQPEVNDTLGFVYLKKDLAPLAVPPLRVSVEKDPKNPIYRYRLGLAYSKTGDKDGARRELGEALKLDQKFPGADEARKLLASLEG